MSRSEQLQMAAHIGTLAAWKRCAGVELLVNVDSREQADLQWLSTAADGVLFSHNLHELRAYNKLAAMAAASQRAP